MRSTIRARATLFVLLGWALANVFLYHSLKWFGLDELSSRCPSHLTQSLFKPSVIRAARLSGDEDSVLRFRLMSPSNRASTQRQPLVIFLHGAGQRGSDNEQQLFGLPEQLAKAEWRQRFACFVLAPQCPLNTSWQTYNEDLVGLVRDLIRRHPIDPGRVYLTGLSMGGYGSWELAIKEPDLFAAIVPICGGGRVTSAHRLINTPIWAIHGDADETVPVEQSREMIHAIRQAGGQPKYTELKNVGHDSWSQAYADPNGVLKWMFEQKRGD